MSLFFLPFLQALWRLVRALFGGARRQADPEDGNFLAVHFPAKNATVVADPIATFKPDLDGVPALALSSMTVGAAFAPDGPISIKAAQFPGAPEIPIIMLTSPTLEDLRIIEKEIVKTRLPLGSITNTAHRVHRRTPRKPRGHDKENIATHPSAPRLTHPRVVYPALSPPLSPFTVRLPTPRSHRATNVKSLEDVKPASAEWQQAKEAHLKQARQWTDAVKARRESLPTPSSSCESKFIARRSSAPVRLSLEQRLRNGCATPSPAKDAHPDTDMDTLPRPGSSTSLESVSSSASMESVLACVLEEFETELESAVWMGLRRFGGGSDEKALRRNCGVYGRKEEREQGDTFDDEESSGDDHWSDVVSLEDY
ncbi:hypothetical protein DFH08DRAFT_932667 [Mycena albidolilacea]|uniref:Uncharacterized protein n=1 Tax=Mycena albidolilacea TaxID=1033008 RepID=A0AAD7AE33_9AGAR|nr:hypothetical protein DFH08DRAFT_932667 [Mycena albidolilacea]